MLGHSHWRTLLTDYNFEEVIRKVQGPVGSKVCTSACAYKRIMIVACWGGSWLLSGLGFKIYGLGFSG